MKRKISSGLQKYNKGLEGLIVGETDIGYVDGKNGQLVYRGHDVVELSLNRSFEEVMYLILYGKLPNRIELDKWDQELKSWRNPPQAAFDALNHVPENSHPLAKYRTMLTVAACQMPDAEKLDYESQWRRPPRILSWSTSLAAAAIRHLNGEAPVQPRDDLGFAANLLYQSLGYLPDEDDVRAFEVSLIVQAEHGLHAAAFAALVVISTGADLGSAVLAGMGALSGVLHGGANQLSYEMLDKLRTPDEATKWVKKSLAENYRFPGFGHRVYKCSDPRVKVLEPFAKNILSKHGHIDKWQIYKALRDQVEGVLGGKGIYANVDSITGLIYKPLGLPVSSFPIPFCLAIQTGWMAHCLEYLPDGPMIEPGAVYIGKDKGWM